MRGLGTLINTAGVIVGGLLGLALKKGMPEKLQKTLMQACGISTIFIGIAGALVKMLSYTAEDGRFSASGTMILILSLVFGGLIGELIDIEKRMESLGEKIKKAVHAENDSRFVDGFVNTSLVICIGAMAIVGSIQDGITGDYSMLMAKSILDLIIVMIFASTSGIGPIFSAIPILFYEGAITLLAVFLGSFVTQPIIDVLCFVGSVIICCVGINIFFGKQVRVGNLLPALVVAVILQLLAQNYGIAFLLA